MYKSDIQFLRDKYRELAEDYNKLLEENRVLKEINARYRELITIEDDGEETQVG